MRTHKYLVGRQKGAIADPHRWLVAFVVGLFAAACEGSFVGVAPVDDPAGKNVRQFRFGAGGTEQADHQFEWRGVQVDTAGNVDDRDFEAARLKLHLPHAAVGVRPGCRARRQQFADRKMDTALGQRLRLCRKHKVARQAHFGAGQDR
jgi:hypothetical protein